MLTRDEAIYLKVLVKDSLQNLHHLRRRLETTGLMTGLIVIEDEIKVAESAWRKLKAQLEGAEA